MQKKFYYKLLKGFRFFTGATYNDDDKTITIPSTSVNGLTGDVTIEDDPARGLLLTSSGNTLHLRSSPTFIPVSGSAAGYSDNGYLHPNIVQEIDSATDPTDPLSRNLSLCYTPPVAVSFNRICIVLDQAPGAGNSVTLAMMVNGVHAGDFFTFTGDTRTVSTGLVRNFNAGDLVCFKVTTTGTPVTTQILWNGTLAFYDCIYP